MKINYDKIADAIYIEIKKGKIAKTKEVSDLVVHDLDEKGRILGIEILHASSLVSSKDLETGAVDGIPLNIITATPVSA